LIAFGANAVLRYRDTHGIVIETVLSGSNPRPILLDNFKGRIVHLGMQGRMPKPWLMLYVVGTGTMNAKTGADYIAAFNRQMGAQDSTVEFRSDPWFFESWSTWFPLFEEHRGDPPSETDFNATKTLRCNVLLKSAKGPLNYCGWKGSIRLP
jgi:hypothetical protein